MKFSTFMLPAIILIVFSLIYLEFAPIVLQSSNLWKLKTVSQKYDMFCDKEAPKKTKEECNVYLKDINNLWNKVISSFEKQWNDKELQIAQINEVLSFYNNNQ